MTVDGAVRRRLVDLAPTPTLGFILCPAMLEAPGKIEPQAEPMSETITIAALQQMKRSDRQIRG